MFERIPKELKENALFCLYKLEQRKGKQTKVPYQVRGARADTSNQKCFSDFSTVERAYEKGGYAELGVGVFEPYVMIDIDHCVTNGELSDMAKKIVGIMDSYTEYSPSGTGVHIIAKVDNFKFDASMYYINNRKLGLEVYVAGATKNYLTITGNVIRGKPPKYRNAELQKVLDDFMKRKAIDKKKQVTVPGSYLSDASVIHHILASKQAEKFKTLWEGEIPEGKSHSEADMTLVQMLAFWFGGDAEQMRKFLKFVHDDVVYCKYYEVVYILFHTGMRISEFCGLTLKDIDLKNRTVNIDHQLQRTVDMRYIIETTKTEAGKRKIPITEDVAMMFQAIIEDREPPKTVMDILGSYFTTTTAIHLWRCIGSIDSTIWLDDIMISTECRCRISRHMYVGILIVRIWLSPG